MSNLDLTCDDRVCFYDRKTSPAVSDHRNSVTPIDETQEEFAPIG
jgi:hypothetical protein